VLKGAILFLYVEDSFFSRLVHQKSLLIFFSSTTIKFSTKFSTFLYRGLIFPQNYTEQRDRETELHKDDKVLLGVGILLEDENEALDAGYCRFGVL